MHRSDQSPWVGRLFPGWLQPRMSKLQPILPVCNSHIFVYRSLIGGITCSNLRFIQTPARLSRDGGVYHSASKCNLINSLTFRKRAALHGPGSFGGTAEVQLLNDRANFVITGIRRIVKVHLLLIPRTYSQPLGLSDRLYFTGGRKALISG
jgi:hypothetical protein